MTEAIRLDGNALARETREALSSRVAALREREGRSPSLTVVLVGDDPASEVYVRNKQADCEKVGIRSQVVTLGASITSEKLRDVVRSINDDAEVDGLIVQLPVPDHLDPAQVREWIDPAKDVDGLHPDNVGRLASETPRFIPCTPLGCLRLLEHYQIPTEGRRAVVLGRSLIVGRPMATLLATKGIDCTVTVCHSRSRDVPEICAQADILIAAAGVPQLIQERWVRPGSAVIDVGIHRVEDAAHPRGARLVGDVHPDVGRVAGYLSPVPGGVGPMTRAMLLENTVRAFEQRRAAGAAA